jgi:hypothetical protein
MIKQRTSTMAAVLEATVPVVVHPRLHAGLASSIQECIGLRDVPLHTKNHIGKEQR